MIYTVYVLISSIKQRSYIGQTNDLERRISEHNNGKVNSTKDFCPLKLIHKEEFNTRTEAVKREKYLKSASGRRFIKKSFFADVAKW